MKNLLIKIMTLVLMISITTINAWNGSSRGAVFGGLSGAAIGGAAGGGRGAFYGGLAGAAVGSAIGSSRDRYYYDDSYDDAYYASPIVYERPARTVVRKEYSYRPANTFAPAQGTVIYVQ